MITTRTALRLTVAAFAATTIVGCAGTSGDQANTTPDGGLVGNTAAALELATPIDQHIADYLGGLAGPTAISGAVIEPDGTVSLAFASEIDPATCDERYVGVEPGDGPPIAADLRADDVFQYLANGSTGDSPVLYGERDVTGSYFKVTRWFQDPAGVNGPKFDPDLLPAVAPVMPTLPVCRAITVLTRALHPSDTPSASFAVDATLADTDTTSGIDRTYATVDRDDLIATLTATKAAELTRLVDVNDSPLDTDDQAKVVAFIVATNLDNAAEARYELVDGPDGKAVIVRSPTGRVLRLTGDPISGLSASTRPATDTMARIDTSSLLDGVILNALGRLPE